VGKSVVGERKSVGREELLSTDSGSAGGKGEIVLGGWVVTVGGVGVERVFRSGESGGSGSMKD
jgi:hypothetical protein